MKNVLFFRRDSSVGESGHLMRKQPSSKKTLNFTISPLKRQCEEIQGKQINQNQKESQTPDIPGENVHLMKEQPSPKRRLNFTISPLKRQCVEIQVKQINQNLHSKGPDDPVEEEINKPFSPRKRLDSTTPSDMEASPEIGGGVHAREALNETADLKERLAEVLGENADLKERLVKKREEIVDLRRKVNSFVVNGNAADRYVIYSLEQENGKLKKELETRKAVFSFDEIASKNELVSHYTGLPTAAVFEALLSLFDNCNLNYHHGWSVQKLSRRDQLFLTLYKLRQNPTNLDLGVRFDISPTTVANIVHTWVDAMHCVFVRNPNSMLSKIPSRFKCATDCPPCFAKYPNTRMILDCMEVRAANPALLLKHNKMFSQYKHYVTEKGLVAIAPNGTVVFGSKLYPGCTSDKDIVADSGVLDCLEPGDSVMADKGFLIFTLLPPGVALNLPPFKETPQFTPQQIDEGYEVAQSRIHVERAIERIKLHRILDFIPQTFFSISSKIFQVCCALTNFRKPLIRDVIESND